MPHLLTPPSRTAQIRNFIIESLVRHGAEQNVQPSESLLIRDGCYCGQRFRSGDFEAVWFVDENEIKFFQSGQICEVVKADEIRLDNQDRMAA